MGKKIFVNSRDEYLVLRLRVLSSREGLSLCETASEPEVMLTVVDLDDPLDHEPAPDGVRVLTLSRTEDVEADIQMPVLNTELSSLLRGGNGTRARLTLSEDEKCAYLDGERIRLTEVECSLLALLIGAEGECVSHHDAVRHIWSGEAGTGAVNVYVHYLREKLEHGGERVILAKRGRGYAIDKKFLGGTGEC